MTYEQVNRLSGGTEEDDKLCDLLAALVETALEKQPFRNMPRSVRMLGAGLGCIAFFHKDGVFYAARNNGADIDIIMETDGDVKQAFSEMLELLYPNKDTSQLFESCINEVYPV